MGGAVPDGAGKQDTPMHLQILALSIFAIGNIALNYFNAWALHDSEEGVPGLGKGSFNFPYFYTMFHMAATAIAALLMQCTCARPPDGEMPSFQQLWNYKTQLVPIAILTFFNTGFNNASLGSIALFVNQVIKATAPLPTSLFEYLFAGKVHSCLIYITISVLVGGCVLSNSHSMSGDESTELGGVIQCMISLVAASLKPVIVKLLTSGGSGMKPCGGACSCLGVDSCCAASTGGSTKKPLTPVQAVFWDATLACCIFFGIFLCNTNERQGALAYLRGDTANPQSGLLGLGIISFGSFLAFSFNIANYYFIMYTSALTSTVGSNCIKIFLIVMTAFEVSLPPLSWAGVAIVVGAIVTYAYLGYRAKAQAAKAPIAIADEKTPLAGTQSAAAKA